MKISIITVSYNAEKSIEDTIKSVLKQKHKNIEYIIIDGKSTDKTLSIINKYRSKITKIISEQDRGIYDAMNKGIKQATGEIVGFLNSDDTYYNSHVLSIINNKFKKNAIDGIHGNIKFLDFGNNIRRMWNGSNYKPGSFESGWSPAHPTFFIKKSLYQKYGGFDISFKYSADFELMLRMIEVYKIRILFISKVLVNFRLGGQSTRSLKNIFRANIENIIAFKKNNILINPFIYIPKRLFPKIISVIKYKTFLLINKITKFLCKKKKN